MFERPPFTLEAIETGLNYGRYKAEPLEQGFGATLGNSLRRILLRSLDGVAISRVRIDNVWHEFTTIDHVREDVTEIVLNLKRVRLKRVMEMNGDVRAQLLVRGDASGERVVTAADVAWPTEVDLITPDQVIATIDSPDGTLDMELWISQGRGYQPAEAQEAETLGEIPIDAIYTPIERVNFVVEQTRVGSLTDYDRLILEILTDGTIEPDDALAQAAQILMEHARIFADVNREARETGQPASSFIPDDVQSKPLADLGLSPRVLNALRSRQIERVGQVLTSDPDQLLSIRNFGPRSLTELRQKLAEFGYLPEGETSFLGGDGVDEETELADDAGDETERDDVAEAVASLFGDAGRDETAGRGDEEQTP
ncbi:MAG: DNA-directed RNA polymerase subunit alpha [Thermomicrobiales bacterium]|nr:DNA-directed RNA polymerase subunit alpha [Thermomicrobiales bacterium]